MILIVVTAVYGVAVYFLATRVLAEWLDGQ